MIGDTCRINIALLGFAFVLTSCGQADDDGRATDAPPSDARAEDSPTVILHDSGPTPHDASDSDVSFIPCGGHIDTGCSWKVPVHANGTPAEASTISVRIQAASGAETPLLQVPDEAQCAPMPLAWYAEYGEDGELLRLVACPETCAAIETSGSDVVVLPGCVDDPP